MMKCESLVASGEREGRHLVVMVSDVLPQHRGCLQAWAFSARCSAGTRELIDEKFLFFQEVKAHGEAPQDAIGAWRMGNLECPPEWLRNVRRSGC
jgi:hypothetical protein